MTETSSLLIQKLRLQHGWSQEQLAVLTGLSARTIQRIERGQNPSAESLKAIAAVFEVDFGTLREAHMMAAIDRNVNADEALALVKVRKIKGFYMHIIQYLVVIAALAVINLYTSGRYLWFGWVALAWGLALAVHGLRAFDKVPFLNGDWERRKVEKYLGRQL